MENVICRKMLENRLYSFVRENDEYKVYFNPEENKNVIVFLQNEDKLNINSINIYIRLMEEEKTNHCVIIYLYAVTPHAKKAIENLNEYDIELFSRDELQYDITEHRLFRKHIKTDSEEKMEIQKYGKNIPIILKTDPISRYYHFKTGDIIRIERRDYTMYRRVI